tara:strand:+ start:52 stop:723 length:672 start_codon:yes stop_codon:yes gene_type:complete
MDESDRNRTLRIEIPPCTVTGTGEDWLDLTGLNGWLRVPSSPLALYWSGSIDLSGYARDYKTFYPSGGVIQEGPYWLAFEGSGQTVVTIVSSVPLNPDTLVQQVVGGGGPGFIDLNILSTGVAQQDWNTVLFAESQVNLINANLPQLGICQPITVKQFGSLSPTAAQVLYVMKLVMPATVASLIGTTLSIPASRVILPGTMDQEPELEYIMRLSRSIELANQV